MANYNVVSGKRINSIFRRSELKFIIIFGLIINFTFAFIINLFFILVVDNNSIPGSTILNPIAYIGAIKSNSIFNFATMSIVSIILSTFYSYYLYIEAKIQFKNRKYYLTVEDNFLKIFSFSISLTFSILLATMFGFSSLNFIKQIDSLFNPMEFYIVLFFMIYIIPGIIIFFFFYNWQKQMLFSLLSLWNSIASTTKRDLNDQIYNAKINNTNIWLVLIRISNFQEICRKYNKNIKFMFKIIVKNIKSIIRTTDFILTFDYNKGLLGYIVANDEKSLSELLSKKIKPYLSNKIKYKEDLLDLVINYQVIDIVKNEDINNLKDVVNYVKNSLGK